MPMLLRPAGPSGNGSRTTLAEGSLVAGYSDRVALFPVLPALGATSGACAPTLATVAVVFCMVSGLRWKSGEGLSTGCAVTRSIFVWIVIAYLSLPMVRVMFCSAVWTGAGRGFWKRSSFATLGIVRQCVLNCKWRQSYYGARHGSEDARRRLWQRSNNLPQGDRPSGCFSGKLRRHKQRLATW